MKKLTIIYLFLKSLFWGSLLFYVAYLLDESKRAALGFNRGSDYYHYGGYLFSVFGFIVVFYLSESKKGYDKKLADDQVMNSFRAKPISISSGLISFVGFIIYKLAFCAFFYFLTSSSQLQEYIVVWFSIERILWEIPLLLPFFYLWIYFYKLKKELREIRD